MSDIAGGRIGRAQRLRLTTLEVLSPYPLSENAIYPNNVKRIIVKGTSKRNLESQVVKVQTNTFTTIIRTYDDLYTAVNFEEI
jgi:hypothetical protein